MGWTDELDPAKLQPVCWACLDGLDPKLRAVQQIVAEAGQELLDRI